MPSAGIRWTKPPEELAVAIERYGDRALQAVAAVAQYVATAMQNEAQATAPWEDRTSNARTGIFGTSEADFANHVVTIYLSHGATIDYGVWLELAHQGSYAVVMRTMESHYDDLMSMLREVFA